MGWRPPVLQGLYGPVSLVVIVVCIVVCYVLNKKAIPANLVADNPVQVLEKKEYWRIVTGAFSHYSLLHIFFNVSSLWSLIDLERFVGSVNYMIYFTILLIFSSLIDNFIRLKFMTDSNPYSVGISAVLFGLMTYMATINNYMTFFGFQIPWSAMPFISCIFTSVFIPGASFIGHLSGIFAGYLISWHLFDWFTPKLYFNLLPWIVIFFALSYKRSHRNQWMWLSISRTPPPTQTRMEGGVLISINN